MFCIQNHTLMGVLALQGIQNPGTWFVGAEFGICSSEQPEKLQGSSLRFKTLYFSLLGARAVHLGMRLLWDLV